MRPKVLSALRRILAGLESRVPYDLSPDTLIGELADEAPLYDRPHGVKPYRPAPMEAPEFSSKDLNADLLALVGSGDLCSKRWIWQQYDYMVRTNTIAGPGVKLLQPASRPP